MPGHTWPHGSGARLTTGCIHANRTPWQAIGLQFQAGYHRTTLAPHLAAVECDARRHAALQQAALELGAVHTTIRPCKVPNSTGHAGAGEGDSQQQQGLAATAARKRLRSWRTRLRFSGGAAAAMAGSSCTACLLPSRRSTTAPAAAGQPHPEDAAHRAPSASELRYTRARSHL